MNSYLPFAKLYKKAFLLAPLLVIVDALCEIVQPALMSNIVDTGIRHKNLHYILHTGGIMLSLSLLAVAANLGNIWYSSQASVGFATGLRKGLFEKIQSFGFATIDRFNTASLVTRLTNDITVVQQVVMMSLRMLIKSPLMMIFAVVMAIRINAGLAVVIAVAIPILGACIFFLLRKALPYFIRMQGTMDKVNGAVEENLINVRVVKAFVREKFEKSKFALSNDALRDISVKASGVVVLITPVMQLIMNVSIVAIILLGGRKIITGGLQVGALISFISYITQVLMSLMMFSMTIMTFSRAGASSGRILEVLHTGADMSDTPQASAQALTVRQGKVEFSHVYFKYHPDSAEYVLKDISFTALPGERIAIIGATGSAKSTLVQLIPRLYDISGGQLRIDDRDIKDYTLKHLRTGIAMVLQKNELFSGTIRDNLKWGNLLATETEMIAAAKDAGAHDFILSFPKQYDTVLGQNGVNISGGQKQRLCLARALLKQPAILILDDSTSAVDTATEARIRKALDRDHGQTTTFIIAQRISSIQAADKIIVLDDGAIAAMGTHDELLVSSREYREIYSSQVETEKAVP